MAGIFQITCFNETAFLKLVGHSIDGSQKPAFVFPCTDWGPPHESISNREYAVKLNSLWRDSTPLKLFKQTVENCYGYGKVGWHY